MLRQEFYKQETIVELAKDRGRLEEALPEKIGPYKVEMRLHSGFMSSLYLASDPNTHRPLAIKVMSSDLLSNQDMIDKFVKEAEIIALADHPNIVKMYGHGEWDGGLYIAMEYLPGISLRQFIIQHSLSFKRGLDILLSVASALSHLHSYAIIHRDIKPENIILTESGQVKLIDFGISQLLVDSEDEDTLKNYRIMGTPLYMSPEQRDNPVKVSYTSDIYSFGIVAYELIMGQLSHGVINLALVPKHFRTILASCLQPNVEDRYQDIVELIIDLSRYIKDGTWKKEKLYPRRSLVAKPAGLDAEQKPDKKEALETEIAINSEEEVPKSTPDIVKANNSSDKLKAAQKIILPQKPPEWDKISVGMSNYDTEEPLGIYYDFFELPDNSYGIIMGECAEIGAESMIYTSILRGMIQTLARLTSKPVELVTILNEMLINDTIDQIFTLSYLILKPQENQMHYISCGYGNIWHIAADSEEIKKISADNIALGIDPDNEFLEVTHQWGVGDSIIFNTYAAQSQQSGLDEEQFKGIILESLHKPANKQSKMILDSVLENSSEEIKKRPLSFIALQRKEK